MMLFAQVAGAMTVADIGVLIVIVLGIAAIVFIVVKHTGIEVPPWLINIALIVLLVVVAVIAIKFVARL